MTEKILWFRGETFFLSNFFLVDIEMDGRTYPSLEHAYQAAKTKSKLHRANIQRLKYPGASKRYGKWLKENDLQRPDWQEVNLKIMEKLLRKKFAIPHLRKMLKNTGDAKLIEGNTWNDRFFGMHQDPDGVFRGKNYLGKLLMQIRSEL